MRLAPGDETALFNGRDGEWRGILTRMAKREAVLEVGERLRAQSAPPDLHLLFAPIKKARTDFIAEKAAEMGAAAIRPVFTRFTNSERVNEDRLRAHGVEAAEQCGLLTVPEVLPAMRLDRLLDGWDAARRIMFCDETADHGAAGAALTAAGPGPWAVLIGLSMAGKQAVLLYLSIVRAVLFMGVSFYVVDVYGALGVAIASCVFLVLNELVSLLIAKKMLGIWTGLSMANPFLLLKK